MKRIVSAALVFLIASKAFAGTTVKSITDPSLLPNVTQIERTIVLDTAFEGGRLSIVETDNGGSTDVGSMIAPSQAYLVYYADGEMRNYAAAFDLGSVYSVDTVARKKNAKDIYVLKGTFVNSDTLQRYKSEITIDVAGLRTGINHTPTSNDEEFGTTYVEATISLN